MPWGPPPQPESVSFSSVLCIGAPPKNPLEEATLPSFKKVLKPRDCGILRLHFASRVLWFRGMCPPGFLQLRVAESPAQIPSNKEELEDGRCGIWAGARCHMSGGLGPLSCSFLGFVLLPVVAAAILSESRSPSRLLPGPPWSTGAPALPVLSRWEQGQRVRPDGVAS